MTFLPLTVQVVAKCLTARVAEGSRGRRHIMLRELSYTTAPAQVSLRNVALAIRSSFPWGSAALNRCLV